MCVLCIYIYDYIVDIVSCRRRRKRRKAQQVPMSPSLIRTALGQPTSTQELIPGKTGDPWGAGCDNFALLLKPLPFPLVTFWVDPRISQYSKVKYKVLQCLRKRNEGRKNLAPQQLDPGSCRLVSYSLVVSVPLNSLSYYMDGSLYYFNNPTVNKYVLSTTMMGYPARQGGCVIEKSRHGFCSHQTYWSPVS